MPILCLSLHSNSQKSEILTALESCFILWIISQRKFLSLKQVDNFDLTGNRLGTFRTSVANLCVSWLIWARTRRRNPSKIAMSGDLTDGLTEHGWSDLKCDPKKSFFVLVVMNQVLKRPEKRGQLDPVKKSFGGLFYGFEKCWPLVLSILKTVGPTV